MKYVIVSFIVFLGCRNNTIDTLHCASNACLHDSLEVIAMNEDVTISYFRNSEINLTQKYKVYSGGKINFYQDSLSFDNKEYFSYEYLVFSPTDTSYEFNFDLTGLPPLFPNGSNNWEIEIYGDSDLRFTRKTNLYDQSITIVYKYKYPFEIISIEESNSNFKKSFYK
jgi:hypothetical protein